MILRLIAVSQLLYGKCMNVASDSPNCNSLVPVYRLGSLVHYLNLTIMSMLGSYPLGLLGHCFRLSPITV